MGYSVTKAADDVLANICERYVKGPSSNVLSLPLGEFLFEVDRKERADGGITGTIHQIIGTNARRAGSFRIAGTGQIIFFHGIASKLWPEFQKPFTGKRRPITF